MQSEKTDIFFQPADLAARLIGPPPVHADVLFGAASHVGLVRKNNEDHYAVVQRTRTRRVILTNIPAGELTPTQEDAYWMSVADGMGGAAYGELASRLAITTIWDLGTRRTQWLMNVGEIDETAVEQYLQLLGDLLNATLQKRADLQPETSGMGTTLTGAYTVGQHAFVIHVGDSRAYLIRNQQACRLSQDHTLAEELLAAGATPAQVRRHRHILTNCLNADGTPVHVDWQRVPLRSGDCLLLCTDGLSDLVTDDEMAAAVNRADTPQDACEALVQLALQRGGKDNVTVVIGQYQFP